jgi:division protein CdvB (Snf7/Vps24/ESCRT-III family)
MSNWDSADRRARLGRLSPEVTRLLDHIRRLVAAQKRLGDGATNGQRAAFRREVARLQQRLANVVRRELAEGLP